MSSYLAGHLFHIYTFLSSSPVIVQITTFSHILFILPSSMSSTTLTQTDHIAVAHRSQTQSHHAPEKAGHLPHITSITAIETSSWPKENALESVNLDPAAIYNLRRKIDRNIMPLLCALYLFVFLGRNNIGKDTKQRGVASLFVLVVFCPGKQKIEPCHEYCQSGNARIAGLPGDLNLTTTEYNMSLSIFYIG